MTATLYFIWHAKLESWTCPRSFIGGCLKTLNPLLYIGSWKSLIKTRLHYISKTIKDRKFFYHVIIYHTYIQFGSCIRTSFKDLKNIRINGIINIFLWLSVSLGYYIRLMLDVYKDYHGTIFGDRKLIRIHQFLRKST